MSHDTTTTYFDPTHPLPWRCRYFHIRSGSSVIAVDENGRHWAITEWECDCGRKFNTCVACESEHEFPLLGSVIAGVVTGRLSDVRCVAPTEYGTHSVDS